MIFLNRLTYAVILAANFRWCSAYSIAILESTCLMKFDFPVLKNLTQVKILQIERETSDYFNGRLNDLEKEGWLTNEVPLTLSVAVQTVESKNAGNSIRTSVSSIVSLVYKSNQTKPILLEQTLDFIMANDTVKFNFSFATESVTMSFEPSQDEAEVLAVINETDFENASTSANVALSLATAILSVMLVVVSFVLLYVSGGWSACQSRCINCLFEEVEDDYMVPNKDTTQTNGHSSFNEDDEEEGNSMATSPAPTSASGVLGAQFQHNPMLGFGIKTPGRNDTSSMMTYDDIGGETPSSERSDYRLPLGITSMRKLPEPESPDASHGITGMIMHRFASNSAQRLK